MKEVMKEVEEKFERADKRMRRIEEDIKKIRRTLEGLENKLSKK